MSVHTTLGGGAHGHLGLVVSAQEYATIPATTEYIRPVHPGVINIPNAATQYVITNIRETHHKNLRQFREVIGVERALIQQIVAAVDPKYLKALRNSITNQISATIPQIFKHLLDNYSDVNEEDLLVMSNMLEGLRFEPNEPIDTIFTEIENYAEICALTNSPLSNKQQIDFGYILILKMLKYKSALRKWNELPAADKTYDNMKTVFRKAQRAIRKTGEITVQEGLNHTELVNFVSEGVFQAMGETERLSQEPTIELEERANAATNVPDYATEMAEMREMLKAMQQMVIQCSNPTNNNNQVQHQTQQQMLQNGMVPIPLGISLHYCRIPPPPTTTIIVAAADAVDEAVEVMSPAPASIVGPMVGATTSAVLVKQKHKATKTKPPSRTKWEDLLRTAATDGVGW